MEVISNICSYVTTVLIVAIPILLITLLFRFIFRKSCKKLGRVVLYCIGGFIFFAIVGTLTDPATWCEHEYEIIENVEPTCTEKGKVVKRCSLCEKETVDYPDMIPHSWGEAVTVASTCTQSGYTKRTCSNCLGENVEYTDKLPHQLSVKSSVDATCTEKGKVVRICDECAVEDIEYIDTLPHSWKVDSIVDATCTSGGYTIEICTACSNTRKTNENNSLGHSMRESSRTEPMVGVDGKIVKKCDRCDYEEIELINKLEPITIKFDGLELVFGQYSFTEVDKKHSDYYGQTVVKIPVTITNLSNDPHSLYYFYYKLFGVSGVESPDLSYYFDDDVSQGRDLIPGKSYVKYFHILYDGDGEYTIVFDDFIIQTKTLKIAVKK